MTTRVREMFLNALPAGEWSNVQIVDNPDGLMASRDWAILAKANWLHGGGRPAFLKCLIPARKNAGSTTLQFTSKARLKRIEDRLARITGQAGQLPLVPILEVRTLEPLGGLLIAMPQVVPLQDLLEQRRPTIMIASRLLRDFAEQPEVANSAWHHFDICPKNIGILPDGRFVLIDPESFYLEEQGHFAITSPAWKPFRAPQSIGDAVHNDLSILGLRLQLQTSKRKQSFEIMLAAAECTLGSLPSIETSSLDEWFAQWPVQEPRKRAVVAFWMEQLRRAAGSAANVDLNQTANDLDVLLKEQGSVVDARPIRIGEGDTLSRLTSAPLAHALTEVLVPAVASASLDRETKQWDSEWLGLRVSAEQLRRGEFDLESIHGYQERLQQLAVTFPLHSAVWYERILVAISYQKDATIARSVVKEAVGHLPDDAKIRRWERIVRLWAGDDSQ